MTTRVAKTSLGIAFTFEKGRFRAGRNGKTAERTLAHHGALLDTPLDRLEQGVFPELERCRLALSEPARHGTFSHASADGRAKEGEAREKQTRSNEHDIDAESLTFHPQDIGQGVQSGLGRGVDARPWGGDVADDGADVGDQTTATGLFELGVLVRCDDLRKP